MECHRVKVSIIVPVYNVEKHPLDDLKNDEITKLREK